MKRRFCVSGTVKVGVQFDVDVDIPDDIKDVDELPDIAFAAMIQADGPTLSVLSGDHHGTALGLKNVVPNSVHWAIDGCHVEFNNIDVETNNSSEIK